MAGRFEPEAVLTRREVGTQISHIDHADMLRMLATAGMRASFRDSFGTAGAHFWVWRGGVQARTALLRQTALRVARVEQGCQYLVTSKPVPVHLAVFS